jgi:hypothetical protein
MKIKKLRKTEFILATKIENTKHKDQKKSKKNQNIQMIIYIHNFGRGNFFGISPLSLKVLNGL